MPNRLTLLPHPQRLDTLGGVLQMPSKCRISVNAGQAAGLERAWSFVFDGLEVETSGAAGAETEGHPDTLCTRLIIDRHKVAREDGYHLRVGQDGFTVIGGGDAGLFHGLMTLKQLLRLGRKRGEIPLLHIEDWPDFQHRGVMLDISRDRVPTMETLFGIVDLLAELKINQFQLYTEHTFAYSHHRTVWANASPATPDEIRTLDAYCRERFIELVPNQNSLAHFERWLKRPGYEQLAELPSGFFYKKPGGEWWDVVCGAECLCPTDSRSVELLEELYDELLPNFSSRLFNIGCDEAEAIGYGRSKAACEERGKGEVYLDFLLQVHRLVQGRGRTMQFWGDILLNYPELIARLPKNVIALDWGYDPEHPYERETARFLENGIEYYVCPGTHSWLSLVGRTECAVASIRNAAYWGLRNEARGLLNTDWGDGGHWNHLPVSYLGYAYGAALSWAYAANQALDLPEALDWHVFHDLAGVMGQLAFDLGNSFKIIRPVCLPVLFPEEPFRTLGLERTNASDWEMLDQYCQGTIERLAGARMDRPDADLILAEYRNAADLLHYSARLAIARLAATDQKVSSIAPSTRAKLAEQRDACVAEYRRLWLARNRPGGLEDSANKIVTGWSRTL